MSLRQWQSVVLGVVMMTFHFAPQGALAQSGSSGAIAGVVRDATGGVLPGVTVEAGSPALIEKVRVAVTDGQGQFKVVDLRPGTYSVTFTLGGFSTFVREDIVLTSGFTANASANLVVGGLEETITVTGASARVDIHDVRQQNVLSRETLDILPTNRSTSGFAALTLGATGAAADVGGNTGEAPTSFGVHGTSGGNGRHLMDGMPMNGLLFGSGMGTRLNFVNQVAVEEVAMTTRGGSAETETGGPQLNYIPKEGGNTFSFSASATGATSSMQSDKITDELTSRGLTKDTLGGVKRLHDVGAGFGGPISEDRIWFFGASRWWDTETFVPGQFFQDKSSPAALGGLLWVPDLNRPAFFSSPNKDGTIRITWQASDRNKFMFSENIQRNCFCYQGVSLAQAPTATVNIFGSSSMTQITWNHPRSNRVLIEGGFTGLYQTQNPSRPEGVSTTDIAVQDTGLNLSYNARAFSAGNQYFAYGLAGDTLAYVTDVNFSQVNGRASVSYVTGSHAFKTGIYMQKGWQGAFYKFNDPPLRYTFVNQVPQSITQWADPVSYRTNLSLNLGLYAQDQWTVKRVTLNYGLRYDSIVAENPPHSTPAGLFIGARDFQSVKNVPSFKDISPRLGIAWDVRGDGKTAVKAQLGRYVNTETTVIAVLNNPAYAITTNVNRTWNDANGDYVPDCDLQLSTANGECGDQNGELGSLATVNSWADDAKEGFGNRGYQWQGSVTVQQELTNNLFVTGGYYHTSDGNFRTTDNRAVGPNDYDPYCLTTPTNSALPGGGGEKICGLFDINPVARRLVDNLVTQTSNFGERTNIYNGFDVAFNARFGDGGFVMGGVSSGQTVSDNCVVVDSPQLYNCKTTVPFAGQTQVKLNGTYPMPYGIMASAVFQNLPGPSYGANGIFFGGEGLPRAFSGGIAFVNMVEPNSLREDRFSQVDLRLSKRFQVLGGRIRVDFDLFNLLNARAILGVSSTYGLVFGPNSAPGAGYRRPSSVLGGRMFKFGAQVDF